jgi:ABC-2 type transport system ATP-binding protein
VSSAIILTGVSKQFDSFKAVDAVSLAVEQGSIYGLLGPNGAGKTTTIRMILRIILPDSGTVEVLGGAPGRVDKDRIGYLPEERGLYRKMKVIDLLSFLGEVKSMPRKKAKKAAGEWLERVGLADAASKKVEELSKGMQQKVQFIGTVLHEPDLLVLDEPFSGLDPINQEVLETIVREFQARGTTVLFSTHLMDHAERLCERVFLISRARRVLDDDLRELKRKERKGLVAVEFQGDDRWLSGPEVAEILPIPEGAHLVLKDGADHQAILRRGVTSGARIDRFDLVEPRLHEIFVRHAGVPDEEERVGLPGRRFGEGGAR